MGVTLDEALSLAGRLDDAPGFDSPRERFRRFLRTHVVRFETARALVDECRHRPGEQHARALQDLVVSLGRFAGFDVEFGSYDNPAAPVRGAWHSPARLRVVLDVRSASFDQPAIDDLLRATAALKASVSSGEVVGVAVVATSLSRRAVEDAVLASSAGVRLHAVSIATLLSIVGMAASGRVAQDAAVRLFASDMPIEFIVGLLERAAAQSTEPSHTVAEVADRLTRQGPAFWVASVSPDHATAPEEFLGTVVAKRHVFAISDHETAPGLLRAGDEVCFYIAGRGVVGRARVLSPIEGATEIRDARRFRQVVRLEDLELNLHQPAAPDAETALRLRAASSPSYKQRQTLLEISQESFVAMTGQK